MLKYKVKNLAQLKPKSLERILPGVYENLEEEVVQYQKKLNNLIEITDSKEPENSFVLELKVEDTIKKPYRKRRNVNDNSN